MTSNTTARCCIAGSGPAGMMLGLLLARAGVEVLVLEKHADFLRDFRGDTIHPSTLELMHELGLLEQFMALPHQKVYELRARFGDAEGVIADFRHLPTRCGFVAFMPQVVQQLVPARITLHTGPVARLSVVSPAG